MDPVNYVCNDSLADTGLDFLCQVKRHTVEHFGQRNNHDNLLSHNNGALRKAIADAVNTARTTWKNDPKHTTDWKGDPSLLEKAWLHRGPKWLQRELAIPRPVMHFLKSA